ncbi:MAG: beta-hydroxyacyl-ACP dehydratase, partial [Actinomycetia bacterium]|nr:beta-hydroxyacyl-ACP dehydratase [Actinomycetes bacterium]
PGRPIVPGVLLCEMMAQTACLLIQAPVGSFMTYYTGLDHVKFKKPVLPGETIVLESQLTAQRGVFYFVQSQGTVDGKLCVSGELSFAVIAEA